MDGQGTRSTRVATSALLAVALLFAGCSSGGSSSPAASSPTEASPPSTTSSSTSESSELQGCVPACVGGLTSPGDVGPGPYKTLYFFGGRMRVTFTGAWTSSEDSTGEFKAMPRATTQNAVFFWEDVYPVRHGNRVEGVPLTAAGLLQWLQSTPALTTSAPSKGRIGQLPATLVDVSVSDKAKNEDPNCPTRACVLFLGFPQWTGDWGIAYTQVQRFYLSDVEYGGVKHLFVAVIYPDKGPDLKTFAKVGEQLLRTVRVPATPA